MVQEIIEECGRLYKEIEAHCIYLIDAEYAEDTYIAEEELKNRALTSRVSEFFKMFFISEYKEKVYESMFDPCFKKRDEDLLIELERIIESMYTYEEIHNYTHDPQHFLFADKFYSFFEYIESKGINILDPWNDTEVYDDEPCDFW